MSNLDSSLTFCKFDQLSTVDADIVYFGSVMQYFHDFSEIGNVIKCVKPASVVIGGTIFTDKKITEGVYAQPNSNGGFQAYTVRRKNKVTDFFKSLGYCKRFEIPEAEVFINLPTLSRPPIAWFQIYEHFDK